TNPSISSAPPTGASEKRPHAPGRPDGVDPQVWADWLQLRKAKKAPVTDTVLTSAKGEAVKAGMSLDAFLRVWCARGSQGLQADWLRPNERAQGNSPSDDRASRAAKAKQLLGISAQPSPQGDFIDG
ncbi:MAG TPA: hypothetical protein VN201_13415, partial [Roseateles sp.]|nr:hypothetical protein [Roseateles sp.]